LPDSMPDRFAVLAYKAGGHTRFQPDTPHMQTSYPVVTLRLSL